MVFVRREGMVVVGIDRTPKTYYGPGGGIYRVVATSGQTGSTHFAFEAMEPPGGGPPLHIQAFEEEFFFVLEGEITFWLGGQVITRRTGGTAFVPRGMPHCFKNCSDDRARVLILFTPGNIEGFFQYGKPLPDGTPPPEDLLMERLAALGPPYGIELVGPSPLP
jgi:quercetin dioxygenase-like cupin family protein